VGGLPKDVYLPWNAVVHQVRRALTPGTGRLVTPMANGSKCLFDVRRGLCSRVLIQGQGQRGVDRR